MTTSSWRLPLAAAIVLLGATAAVRTQTPRPMGIVDLLNMPRLSDPQLSPDGKQRALHPRRRRLEERPPHLAHLARAGRRRPAGAADQRRRRRERPALVARRQDHRLHRQARRRRVRADLSAADRRRRSASADDARERGVGADLGAGRRGDLLQGAPSRRPPRRRRARKRKDDVFLLRRELQADAPLEGDGRVEGRARGSPTAISRSPTTTCRRTAARSTYHARADAAARRRRSQRSLGDGCRRRQRACRSRTTRCRRPNASISPDNSQVLFISGVERELRDLLQRTAVRRAGRAAARRAC